MYIQRREESIHHYYFKYIFNHNIAQNSITIIYYIYINYIPSNPQYCIINQHYMDYIKCSSGTNKCYLVCKSQPCYQKPFMCLDTTCQCHKLHDCCQQSIVYKVFQQNLLKRVKQKSSSAQLCMKQIDQQYKMMIKQIEKSYNQFKNRSKLFGLNTILIEFVNKLNEGKTIGMTGSYMNTIFKQIKKDSTIMFNNQSIKQINNSFSILINSLNSLKLEPDSPTKKIRILNSSKINLTGQIILSKQVCQRQYLCKFGHNLSYIGANNANLIYNICCQCNKLKISRSFCQICKQNSQQGFVYCCLCRTPAITKIKCPLNHTFKMKISQLNKITCDYCLNMVSGEYCYNDKICDYAVCIQCFNKLPGQENKNYQIQESDNH